MLWHAITEPQRHTPRGEAGVTADGQPVFATDSSTSTRHRWRA